MKNNIEFYDRMKSIVPNLEFCEKELESKYKTSSVLKNECDEITKFSLFKRVFVSCKIAIPICTILLFLLGTSVVSVLYSSIFSFIAFGTLSIPLFLSLAEYETAKENLIKIGSLKSFAKEELLFRQNQIKEEYSKVQKEIKTLEVMAKKLNEELKSCSIDTFKSIEEEVTKVDDSLFEFMDEFIDYRNTHLILNEQNEEQDKKLVKSCGKI